VSASLPNGSIFSMASTYGTTKNMTALTNASQAVATLEASHGIVTGDVFEVTSGWSRVNGSIQRAQGVSTNDVTIENLNTTSTTRYPAGTGTGTIREVTAWAEVPQITAFDSSGGDQQFTQFQYLSETFQRQKSTVKSAQGLQITIADDPSLAIYALLTAADEDGLDRAFKLVLPTGAVVYYNGQVSFNNNVKIQINSIITVQATVSLSSKPTRFTS